MNSQSLSALPEKAQLGSKDDVILSDDGQSPIQIAPVN